MTSMKPVLRVLKTSAEKIALAVALIPVIAAIFYFTIPLGNTDAAHFDTLLVLGYPSNPDGTPSPEQRERVLEAVHQYRAGVAPAMILSGGAAHNHFVEAHAMSELAKSSGVPASAIVEEDRAQNTIENVAYSTQIMRAHGWQSAEVITSAAHVRRASYIVMYSPISINWHMQASPWPTEYGLFDRAVRYSFEAFACADMRIFGLQSAGVFHRLMRVVHFKQAGLY